jgi:hypothetical protein
MPISNSTSSRRRTILAALSTAFAAIALLAPAAGAARHHSDRLAERHARVGLSHNEAVTPRRIASKQARPQVKATVGNGTTSTAPPPAPAPPVSTSLEFHGDGISDFALAQSAPGAITEVLDPAGSGETVFKMTVSDNDGYPVTPTENPRAELLSPSNIESGDEFWWSAKFFLPAEFPSATPNFVTLLQGPYGYPWNGTPPFHIEANSGILKWQRNETYGWDIPWQMPEVRSQWVDVMIHERFAADGWVEMWVDGQQITFFANSSYNPRHLPATTKLEMATMDSTNNQRPNAIYLQQYRKKGMYPSLTVYQGPLTIGTTQQAVEG